MNDSPVMLFILTLIQLYEMISTFINHAYSNIFVSMIKWFIESLLKIEPNMTFCNEHLFKMNQNQHNVNDSSVMLLILTLNTAV